MEHEEERKLTPEEEQVLRYVVCVAEQEIIVRLQEITRKDKVEAIRLLELNREAIRLTELLLERAKGIFSLDTLFRFGVFAYLNALFMTMLMAWFIVPSYKIANWVQKKRLQKAHEVMDILVQKGDRLNDLARQIGMEEDK